MQNRNVEYLVVEAAYDNKLVVKNQLVEVGSDDTFRSLLLRALRHDALKERIADLKLQVAFRMGGELVVVPSPDDVVAAVLARFPDVKALRYSMAALEGGAPIQVEALPGPGGQRRARLLRVLGWVVRIVGAYELLLLAIRVGLRLAGVGAGGDAVINTDMAETIALAEAVVQMDSEQLEEVRQAYDLSAPDFAALKGAVREERQRRGLQPSSSGGGGGGGGRLAEGAGGSGTRRRKGAGAELDAGSALQPWVPSGEADDEELDGALGADAALEYDQSAQQQPGGKR